MINIAGIATACHIVFPVFVCLIIKDIFFVKPLIKTPAHCSKRCMQNKVVCNYLHNLSFEQICSLPLHLSCGST